MSISWTAACESEGCLWTRGEGGCGRRFSAMLERWLREPVEEVEACLSSPGGWPSWVVFLKFMAIGFDLCGSGELMVTAGGSIIMELVRLARL